MITRDLRRAIANAVAAAGFARTADPGLRPTGTPGQYAASVALTLGQDPRETAQSLAAQLADEQWIARVEVTGPGYLTITVTPEALAAVADNVTRAGPACVTSDALAGLTVPPAPPGDPLTAPTWEKARAALAARLTARLAAAAGATIAEPAYPERWRLTLPAHPSSLEPPKPPTEVSPATSGPVPWTEPPEPAEPLTEVWPATSGPVPWTEPPEPAEPLTEVWPATSGPVPWTEPPEPTSPGRLGTAQPPRGQPAPPAESAESAPDDGPVPFPGAESPPSLAARPFTNSEEGAGASRPRSDDPKAEPDARPQSRETDIAAAVAFSGRDAVTFTLARAIPGKPLRVDPEIIARHVPGNPAYAVRYAHARAASGVRWAATSSGAAPPRPSADQGETAWPTSVSGTGAPPPPIGVTGGLPSPIGVTGGPPPPIGVTGGPPPPSAGIGGYGGSPPREKTVLALLDALSWLPERVATAARRGRPDEFARYLEDLASVTVDILRSTSHPGSAGPDWAAAPGSERLTLAMAARTGLAAGLGLLGVSAPDRL